MVDNIIGFMDRVAFPVLCTDKRISQNAMYCGYDCDTMVNNVFAYSPDGKVFFAAVNFSGSWADGSLTAHFLHYMKRKIGPFKICVYQGFPRSGAAYRTIVGPFTKWQTKRLYCDVHNYLLKISNVHTLLWQTSGGCVGFRVCFLAVKVVCQVTLPNIVLFLRQLFLFTISTLIMLATVR